MNPTPGHIGLATLASLALRPATAQADVKLD